MSKYTVRVVGHEPFDIELPAQIALSAPATPTEAREAIASAVEAAVRPHLHYQPPTKLIERDPEGRIAQLVEHPATSAETLAATVGRRIAREIVADE